MDLEKQARGVGENPIALKTRLIVARAALNLEMQRQFSESSFDIDNKRMVSNNNRFALQWKIRKFPGKPISYINQQTNEGIVELINLKRGLTFTLQHTTPDGTFKGEKQTHISAKEVIKSTSKFLEEQRENIEYMKNPSKSEAERRRKP